jgi:predicted nucleic acid-binding protein
MRVFAFTVTHCHRVRSSRGLCWTVTTYVDSSALVPLYVPERFSEVARSVVRNAGQVPFTAIHQLEVPNAFELLNGTALVPGDQIASDQRTGAIRLYAEPQFSRSLLRVRELPS